MNQIPQEFWYILSCALAAALVGIFGWYAKETSATLKELVKNDIKQDGRLERHDEQINDLERFKDSMHIVKYKQSEV
jgi:hypothetical protein